MCSDRIDSTRLRCSHGIFQFTTFNRSHRTNTTLRHTNKQGKIHEIFLESLRFLGTFKGIILFVTHKFALYSKKLLQEHETDMPPYFKFLTVMAFHVFLGEKVDVAIIEVGIGGEHDCTNIIRNTKTAGISSLGLDHTQILGETLREIAWQKSGIIKPNCNVFSSPQPDECVNVLQERSADKQVGCVQQRILNIIDSCF